MDDIEHLMQNEPTIKNPFECESIEKNLLETTEEQKCISCNGQLIIIDNHRVCEECGLYHEKIYYNEGGGTPYSPILYLKCGKYKKPLYYSISQDKDNVNQFQILKYLKRILYSYDVPEQFLVKTAEKFVSLTENIIRGNVRLFTLANCFRSVLIENHIYRDVGEIEKMFKISPLPILSGGKISENDIVERYCEIFKLQDKQKQIILNILQFAKKYRLLEGKHEKSAVAGSIYVATHLDVKLIIREMHIHKSTIKKVSDIFMNILTNQNHTLQKRLQKIIQFEGQKVK